MFDPDPLPRLFSVPPGADFPLALAIGLRDRLAGASPEAMARVEVLVNTARMQARVREAFLLLGPGFLPRIRLITDLAPSSPTLRVRLELAQMIRQLLRAQPDLAPQAAVFALAESLFDLLDEIHAEGVSSDRLERLDVSQHSQHWERSLRFLRLVNGFSGSELGAQAQLAKAVAGLAEAWRDDPPRHPVIVAGSTGSRGPTAALMRLVARLPQGALVLPGFDHDLPESLFDGMNDPLLHEDHPQFRFARLLRDLGLGASAVRSWTAQAAPDPARNAVFSLALRPAPVTDQWITEGPSLGDLVKATQAVTLIEANDARSEAQAIALCLRQALFDGRKAALITPDRTLARRVTAILDGWSLRPDDSAGRPLGLTAPGRLCRQTAQFLADGPTALALIEILKNPLVQNGPGRGAHLRHLRDLELHLRAKAISYPDERQLSAWIGTNAERDVWVTALRPLFLVPPRDMEQLSLPQRLSQHRALLEALATSPGGEGSGSLWQEPAGEATRALLDGLAEAAESAGAMTSREYQALLDTLFASLQVREAGSVQPDLMILGTLEARAQGAELVVLGGLNDGVWPPVPAPDPWFNRKMRLDLGLTVPERQIGLSAHDFQQAAGAPEIVLSRARRDSDAETIPSRWLNRFINLVGGLAEQSGPQALSRMRQRGARWLGMAAAIDADLSEVPLECAQRNPRPAPAPPAKARLRDLSVTRVETLIRDPYAVYAEKILRLRPLEPLSPLADPRLRGTALHRIPDLYLQQFKPGDAGSVPAFLAIAETVLAEECPWPWVRKHWLARLDRVARPFVEWNREQPGQPVLTEKRGAMVLPEIDFLLTGQPDRIDRDAQGRLWIYDYKTGALPSAKQTRHFNKQLPLLAIMAGEDAFGLGPAEVAEASFVGLGSNFEVRKADVSPPALAEHRAALVRLLARYQDPRQGFTAQRAVDLDRRRQDYDALSRRGEWQPGDPATTIPVGGADE